MSQLTYTLELLSDNLLAVSARLIRAISGIIVSLLLILKIKKELFVLYLLLLPWLALLIMASGLYIRRLQTEMQKYMAQMSEQLQQCLLGHEEVALGLGLAFEKHRFSASAQMLQKLQRRYYQVIASSLPLLQGSMMGSLLFFSLYYSRHQEGSEIYTHIIAASAIVENLRICSALHAQLQRGLAAIYEVFQQLKENVDSMAREKRNALSLSAAPRIEGTQVKFAAGEYALKRTILDDLTFQIPAEELTLILGPSGGGKSTFGKLIAGVYSPTDGRIEWKTRDETTHSIYAMQVGYVSQEPHIFPISLADNITYPEHVDETSRLLDILKETQLLEWVATLSQGMHTSLDPSKGLKLSGGQKQRIALARALWKDALLYVLDEPTSAQDPINKCALQNILKKLRQRQKTILLITHDLSYLSMAENILMIRNGSIDAASARGVLQEFHDQASIPWGAAHTAPLMVETAEL